MKQSITIDAEEIWTEWSKLPTYSQLFISGMNYGSTVTFQGRPDDSQGPYDIMDFTLDTFYTIVLAHTAWEFRAGVKAGKYNGSDSILLMLEA